MSSGLMAGFVILDELAETAVRPLVVHIRRAFPDEEADVALGGDEGVTTFFESTNSHLVLSSSVACFSAGADLSEGDASGPVDGENGPAAMQGEGIVVC